MKKFITFLILFPTLLSAQMWNGVDTLYGNEWIQYDQNYYKISIANDGIYRIPYQSMADQGIPVSSFQGNQLQLYYMGQEIPIYVSTDGNLASSDYVEFYGEKNRGDLDRHLFINPDFEMSNPEYSLFTDTSAYFLTWNDDISTQRMENINNDLTSAPTTAEAFCWYTETKIFNETWSKDIHTGFTYYSRFEKGEGFVSPFNQNQSFIIQPVSIFTAGPVSKLSLRYTTGTNIGSGTHNQIITVNGDILATDNFVGIQPIQHELNLTTSSLPSEVEVKLDGTFNNKDKSGVAFIKLKYPRIFDFEASQEFHFEMPSSSSNTLLEISNFDAEGNDPILYDLTNNLRIVGTFDGTLVKVVLPPSTEPRKLVLSSSVSAISSIQNLSETNFIDYSQEDVEFIFISNKSLFDDGQGNNWVEEYADFRSSPEGRNFSTIIVDVQQLYEQFSYGINRHSISIRNFGHFVNKNWTNPKYFLLVGKGREYQTVRSSEDLNEAIANNTFFVPTFGAKGGADNLFLSNNVDYAPIISLGRIPVKNGTEIKTYLNKVIEHENNQTQPQTIEDKLWMKDIIHLGGGSPSEQPLIKNYLNGMKNIVENNKFGGNVTSFFKQTSDPIQISQTDALKSHINNGVSFLTFFGHSSAGNFDYSIDNASSYENKGKYPVMFSFGCYSGQIHSQSVGISEDFVLTPEKGAIAFFASTGVGFTNTLNTYGREFYNQVGGDSYGMGIGDLSRITIENTQNSITHLGTQMTLNGDPSIRVFFGDGPDYIIDRSTVKFNPNPISIQLDSFSLSFDIANIGYNKKDSILIEVMQKLPIGDDKFTVIIDTIPTPAFKTSLSYKIPVFGSNALGPNEFFIEIDKNNSILEFPDPQGEENNTLQLGGASESITVHFISKEVIPVFPNEFAIVSNSNLTLKASTSTTFLESQKYILQIDTSENFNSPLLLQTEIEQKGGVLKWQPNVNYQNNTVYYWRVSPEEDPTIGGFIWKNSSFLYLQSSSEGWNQSHYYQFKKDRFSNMELPENGKFKFITDFKDISVNNFVITDNDLSNSTFVWYSINSSTTDSYFGIPKSGVYVAVFDPVEIEPRPNPAPPSWNDLSFSFPIDSTAAGRENLINFLNNDIVDGEYVLFYTVQKEGGNYYPNLWASDVNTLGTSIFDILEAEGATQVRNLETIGSVPYAFMYQKGSGALNEMIANSTDDNLNFNYAVPGSWDNGFIESTKIGPASSWETLSWDITSLDNIPTDEYSVDIIGIDKFGNDSLLFPVVQDLNLSLSSIDATVFPYLRLQFNSLDSVQKTSINLDYWRVLYKGLPEVALNPASFFTFKSDTLKQGEPLELKIAIENIGRYDMDSLLMKFAITDQSNNQDTIITRLTPIISGDTLIATLNLDTRNFGAKNTLLVEANPNNDQAEKFHFNNLGFFDFYVEQDDRNPILDVTFDGLHIMDGDLVSSKPRILITLKDENEFLLLDDTSSFQVLLKSPNNSELLPIAIDGEQLIFYPAIPNSTNKARLEFNPILLSDGTYQLVVLAEDVSGNQSGDLAYKVSFEVTNKSSISKILNYPNPFSTSTKFVFTITGDEIPEEMKIQIMTVSGRIIREIRMEELSPIHIGNNITPFSWDGTDEYGAKLANGVYLYRVVATKANGESFEPFQTKADQFFKNGIGKMVIIR